MGAELNLLVLSAAGLGDFILGTPAFRAIRTRYPVARIFALTIPEVEPLAQRCPLIDRVITVNLRWSRSALSWLRGRHRHEIRQLVTELRSARFDIAVNLQAFGTLPGWLRMRMFLRLIGARRTVVRRDRHGFGLWRTTRAERHEIEAQLEVAREIGAETSDSVPELWVTEADRAEALSLLEQHGLHAREPFACLQVGSAAAEKRWPLARFVRVGERLARLGARVVVIGSADERCDASRAAEYIPNAVSVAGETTLTSLAAVLERARLLVANDSGPMHMAAALGTPTLVAFGPGSPARFGPRGRGPCRVFSGARGTGGAPWWESVSEGEVSDAAAALWQGR